MRLRRLGDSDLHVSEIGLGSWLTYGDAVPDDRARKCIDAAFAAGINFIDTANVLARGGAETFLGRALARRPRDSYLLATKAYFPMDDSGENQGLSRQQVLRQLDASLARLRTDYVDLFQCHRYDPETPLEETMAALTEVVRAGKARYLGFSEWSPDQIRASLALSREHGYEKFVSSQPQYSLLWRAPEDEIFPLCTANGISQIVWSPLAQGALTGKYMPGAPPPEDSRAARDRTGGLISFWQSMNALERVQQLVPIARRLGLSLPQLALAWVLRKADVASAIVGATRPEQVVANATASGVQLDKETLAAIDRVLSR